MKTNQAQQLNLLGPPEAVGFATKPVAPTNIFVLIAAIILSPSRQMTRKSCANLLWPEADAETSSTALRQLLHRAKAFRQPGSEFIKVSKTEVIAGADVANTDLVAFFELSESSEPAELKQALTLFRSDLLDGVEINGEEGHAWLERQRSELRDRFFRTCEKALRQATRYGRGHEAWIDDIRRQMLAIDPEREETHSLIVDAYVRIGDVTNAQTAFKNLENSAANLVGPSDPDKLVTNARRRVVELQENLSAAPAPEAKRRNTPRVAFNAPTVFDPNESDMLVRCFIEDVADTLARFRSFAVIAPYSSFQVNSSDPESEKSLGEIDYIVKCNVISFSDRLSFTLIDKHSGEIIWSAEFDLKIQELRYTFQIVTKQTAATIADQLEQHQVATLSTRADTQAYSLYLQGLEAMTICDLPGVRRARKHLMQAISEDRHFADAHAKIAQTLQLEWLLLGGNDPTLLNKARSNAENAVDIDPAASVGQWMIAVVAMYQREYELTEEKFREAEALSPNSPDLLVQYADALSHMGEADLGWSKFEKALSLNPLPPDKYWWAGAGIAFHLGDYRKAADLCRRMRNIEPALRVLVSSLGLLGEEEEAQIAADHLREIYPNISAKDLISVSPDRTSEVQQLFFEGLRRAGIA